LLDWRRGGLEIFEQQGRQLAAENLILARGAGGAASRVEAGNLLALGADNSHARLRGMALLNLVFEAEHANYTHGGATNVNGLAGGARCLGALNDCNVGPGVKGRMAGEHESQGRACNSLTSNEDRKGLSRHFVNRLTAGDALISTSVSQARFNLMNEPCYGVGLYLKKQEIC